jgi:hypothetical protein
VTLQDDLIFFFGKWWRPYSTFSLKTKRPQLYV